MAPREGEGVVRANQVEPTRKSVPARQVSTARRRPWVGSVAESQTRPWPERRDLGRHVSAARHGYASDRSAHEPPAIPAPRCQVLNRPDPAGARARGQRRDFARGHDGCGSPYQRPRNEPVHGAPSRHARVQADPVQGQTRNSRHVLASRASCFNYRYFVQRRQTVAAIGPPSLRSAIQRRAQAHLGASGLR